MKKFDYFAVRRKFVTLSTRLITPSRESHQRSPNLSFPPLHQAQRGTCQPARTIPLLYASSFQKSDTAQSGSAKNSKSQIHRQCRIFKTSFLTSALTVQTKSSCIGRNARPDYWASGQTYRFHLNQSLSNCFLNPLYSAYSRPLLFETKFSSINLNRTQSQRIHE